ncbi:hypothetical protein BTA35_0211740 [Oceanospirillum linum]|uniref:FAD:protein FMN transferase n=2 Tax=Oceanospirillum linum TaxID=966 RepID=A0A1T1HA85_OCELI|nr:hypothetical protein BTA35_0211740 [Oceanospirillum linum]
MASDCELLIDLPEERIGFAKHLADIAVREVWRIEQKYSRYQDSNTFTRIHQQTGRWQNIDEETYRLLAFADQGWQISDGLFDLTSGVLRSVWSFDGKSQPPSQADLDQLLPRIGWFKLDYRKTGDKAELLLPEDMELDFGGIGKEYAVDRALGLMLAEAQADETPVSALVNLGGDMACSGLRLSEESWKVAIERPDTEKNSLALLSLSGGGLATSGDSRRFLLKDGVRYSHVLNPKTGWPVDNAPRSVTVAAPSCAQSGLIATLALLQGPHAEDFLKSTGLRYWLVSN